LDWAGGADAGYHFAFGPDPRNEQGGLTVGGVSFGIETRHSEKVSPIVSVAMILGGAGLMIAAKKKSWFLESELPRSNTKEAARENRRRRLQR
jgi:hypothetical protein